MTAAARPVTGSLRSTDEQLRLDAIVSVLPARVHVVGDDPELLAAIAERGTTTVVDEPGEPVDALVARTLASVDGLGESGRARVTAALAAGTAVVVDTLLGDPVLELIEVDGGDDVTLLGVVVYDLTVLGPPGGELPSPAADAVPGQAATRRVLAFIGLPAPAGAAVAVPVPGIATIDDECRRLKRRIDDLEAANRRLAEGRLGVHDAAAARAATGGEQRQRLRWLEDELASALANAKQNDELFQDARLRLYDAEFRASSLAAELARHRVNYRLAAKGYLSRTLRRLKPGG